MRINEASSRGGGRRGRYMSEVLLIPLLLNDPCGASGYRTQIAAAELLAVA
jgi:hypothetical protein